MVLIGTTPPQLGQFGILLFKLGKQLFGFVLSSHFPPYFIGDLVEGLVVTSVPLKQMLLAIGRPISCIVIFAAQKFHPHEFA